ncbi:MAG TPA: efflux RND transporter periplasmic adaptor subunit [Opitutaceae bacterium]|nr:efflux RND transporter periplasmic adaptor subunit [Opitutaceae bacterium]
MQLKLSMKLFLLPLALIAMAAVSACSKPGQMAGKPADVDYYTCAMHPSVRSQNPDDKCPICGMNLVPVMKKGSDAPAGTTMAGQSMTASPASADQPSEFTIPLDRQQLIGVTYAKVARYPLHSVIRAAGTVMVDMQRHWEYVARVDGYVHELKVFSPGEIIEKGQVLMDIYSPDLAATQNEFLDLLNMRDKATQSGSSATQENAAHLLTSARERLRRWNLTDAQIDELATSRKAGEFLTLTSPFRGVVEAVPVDQGRRITIGDHLVDVADLSHVWVWAEFYQDELPLLHAGMTVSISTTSLPGEVFTGQIAVIDPFIDEMKRTGRVRIDLENSDFKLRPEMYVNAELAVEHGESLVVPFSAVLPTGTHNIVFVDKGGGKLEPRFVELSGKFGDFYAVASGLKEGERVVSSANFLIDAEAKVQGALKSW